MKCNSENMSNREIINQATFSIYVTILWWWLSHGQILRWGIVHYFPYQRPRIGYVQLHPNFDLQVEVPVYYFALTQEKIGAYAAEIIKSLYTQKELEHTTISAIYLLWHMQYPSWSI